jgi:hypothetical protein
MFLAGALEVLFKLLVKPIAPVNICNTPTVMLISGKKMTP